VCLSCANAGAQVAWMPPTYKNARPLWKFAEQMTGPVANRLSINKTERTIEFPSGGSLAIYTADSPVGILGNAFDLFVMEEAARCKEDIWTETVLPTLADRDGLAYLISTPRGRDWFWREFQIGLEDMQATGGVNQASFQAPSRDNPNPRIQGAYDKAKTRLSSRTFAQEWDAQFVEDGAGVIRYVDRQATATRREDPEDGHTYTIGVDWGRSGDATWFCVMDVKTRANPFNDRMTETDYNSQRTRLKALAARWNHASVMAEYNSIGGPMVEKLQEDGLEITAFITTNNTKMLLIDTLALAFEIGSVTIEPDEILIGELKAFESERLPTGLIKYGAPEGMHDDGVIALALAYHSAESGQMVLGTIE